MILYMIADKLYRAVGCNLAASRRRAGIKLWWNSITQRDFFKTHHVTDFDEKTGEPIFTDFTGAICTGIAVAVANDYNNQPEGKKDPLASINSGLFMYLLATSTFPNMILWRPFLIIWDLFWAQPCWFMWDMCMLPHVLVCKLGGDVVWDEQVEHERSIELQRLQQMNVLEISRYPVYRKW